eukprot:Pgem_evm1s15787
MNVKKDLLHQAFFFAKNNLKLNCPRLYCVLNQHSHSQSHAEQPKQTQKYKPIKFSESGINLSKYSFLENLDNEQSQQFIQQARKELKLT